jgi:hypothetical protein
MGYILMTKILGIAGAKQSGKSTSVNWILGVHMKHRGIVQKMPHISDKGELIIFDLFGDEEYAGVFDITRRNEGFINFKEQNIDEYVKIYHFADELKRICIDVLGLSYEQCYGTDEEKNSPTEYNWINMPDFLEECVTNYYEQANKKMTAREILQHIGTEIFRCLDLDIWVKTTFRRIDSEQPELAIIPDCRFPNEIEAIKLRKGKILKLLRQPHEDSHKSETSLKEYQGYDAIMDNRNMSIQEQCDALAQLLVQWDFIPELEE